MGACELFTRVDQEDLEMQIGALRRTNERREADAQLVEKVRADVVQYVLLGGGGEAADGSECVLSGELANEARCI